MEEHYLFENTDSLKLTANLGVNSSSIIVKKKQYKIQFIIPFLSLLMMLFFIGKISAQTTTVTISTTGASTWTVPAGVIGSITVEAWGAGGSGGGASGSNVTGSGGTGGSYVSSTFSGVVAGTIYNLYVAPQTAAATSGADGNNGTASWFNTNLILNANGGLGGKSSNGAAVTAVTTGSVGTTKIAGGSSLSAAPVYYGTAGGAGGNGGGAGGTNSASPSNNFTDAGNPGSAPGGGGGGGATGGGSCGCSTNGGTGARGEIRITFTCPVNTVANAGSNQTLAACATTTTLAGNTPTYGTGTWSVVSGTATITTPSSPTSGVTGLVLGTTATLRWTVTNGQCGSSTSDVTLTTSMGPGCLVYCTSDGGTFANGITGVVFNTINNTGTAVNVAYTNFTAISTTITKGNSYNLNLYLNTGGNFKDYQSVWIDWNANGIFTDPGEFYNLGSAENVINGLSSLSPLAITVPIGASTAAVRMRIQSKYNATTTGSCDTTFDGEVEDYTLNIIDSSPCVTPTAQPTTLSLTPTATTIPGSFTLASPAANNYLIVVNTSGVVPTPVNGTTYTVGSTVLGGTNVVVDIDSNNTFTATGLSGSTTYYVYVFSYNSLCSGGPLYRTTSPLNGTATTLTFCPSSSTLSTYYIASFKTTGAIIDAPTNNTGYSSTGYANYTTNTPAEQIAGGGINISLTLGGGIQFVKVWVDWNKNNVFDDLTELTFSSTTAFVSNTFGFVVPAGTALGDYKMRIRSKKTNSSFTSCNGEPDGETEDYTIRVIQDCTAKITSAATVERCGEGTITLVVVGTAPTTSYKWYNTDGTVISGATSSSYTTPSLSITTTYYVTALNGTCESLIRKPIIAKIKPIPNITITPENPEICGEKTLLEISAAGSTEVVDLFSESFEGTALGGFTKINLANGSTTTEWQQKTSVYTTATVVWKPAISSGDSGNKFAFTTSDVSGSGKSLVMVTTNNINTTSFTDLTLSFRQYFSYYGAGDSAIIEVSTDGTSWTPVQTYTSTQGSPGKFTTVSIPLTAYIGNTTLKFRFRYEAGFCDGWAIDDVLLYGIKPLTSNFTWTGATIAAYTDAAATIPYTNQLVNTVYIKPSLAQLEVTSWSFNANVQLTNGCSASKAINVTNTSKIWQGLSTNWGDLNNWKPSGVPTSANCVIIPNTSVIPGSNYNAYAKNLTVKSTGNLELPSTSNLTVTDFVNVNTGATFNIRDKASLIQINNVANTGSVNIERTTRPISKLDYTYWSSPVAGFTLGGVSAFNSYMYSWIPTISGNGGNWNPENNSRVMSPGNGFILRSPWGHTDGTTYTTTFVGTPNNGDITTPISKGTLIGTVDVDAENDEWNLIGNPYPSALDAAKFLNLASNVPVIDGTLYLWTHNSQPNAATIDPFYGDYALNYTDTDYAVFNTTGGTATAPASTGGAAPTGYIASGQSFFVKASNSMTNGTTANVTFNNSMRVGVEGKNGDFFKLTKNNKDESIPKNVTDIERHRIWINLTNNSGAFSQTLVGYVAGATQELDRSFDGESLGGNDVTFYSIIPEAELTIQGRALPFDENDQVTLGYNSEISGDLSIRIDHIDGLFDNQKIYLEDKELNVIHNLKETPYVFSTEIGDFNDRFTLRFTDKTLETDTFSLSKSDEVNVIVNQNVTVQSANQLIKNIAVYDLSGRKIDSYKKVNALKYTLSHLNKTTAGLIIKITLENDTVVSKKIIY